MRPGKAGAFPLGIAFAAGWTPCIGPVLAGILAIAASGGTVKGAALLVVYSLGLGLPFLLVGLGVDRLVRTPRVGPSALPGDRRRLRGAPGAVGILLMTGLFRQVFGPLARFAPGL